MATTGQNFVLTGGTTAALKGATVTTSPYVLPLDPVSAQDAINAAPPSGGGVASGFTNNSATSIDRIVFDSALLTTSPGIGTTFPTAGTYVGNFAKNGALYVTFTGTTAVTVDFTDISAAVGVTSSQAGDTTVTTLNYLMVRNVSSSASTIVMSPGSSSPLTFPHAIGGTSPTVSLLLGGIHCEYAVIGKTVDSTHKNVTFTPTVGGAIEIVIGGA